MNVTEQLGQAFTMRLNTGTATTQLCKEPYANVTTQLLDMNVSLCQPQASDYGSRFSDSLCRMHQGIMSYYMWNAVLSDWHTLE